MNADADIQVWLETMARTQPSIIVPHVESKESTILRYRVRTVKIGKSGRSALGQSGVVTLVAGVPATLGKMSLSRDPGDACYIELELSTDRGAHEKHRFACPS